MSTDPRTEAAARALYEKASADRPYNGYPEWDLADDRDEWLADARAALAAADAATPARTLGGGRAMTANDHLEANLTARERDRLLDLLAKWTEADDPNLTGQDRDAIARLRHLLWERGETR